MTLTTDIQTADVLLINLEVYVAGSLVSDVLGVDSSCGLLQRNSQASLLVVTRPSWAEEGLDVAVWAGYNGDRRLIFTGSLSGLTWTVEREGKSMVALDCRDVLWRLDQEWGGADLVYSTTDDDGEIVVSLLTQSGITGYSVESSGWIPAQIQNIVLTAGDPPWSLIERLDFFSGYKTFCRPDGIVYRLRISGAPAPSGAWTATEGVDILDISRRRDIVDDIYNVAQFSGLEWEGVEVYGEASATNPWLSQDRARVEQDDLLQLNADAANAAQIFVADHNRRNEGLELTLIGNPLIQPGQTIRVVHSRIEQSEVLTLVDTVRHSVSAEGASFTTTVTTTGGNLSGYNASAPQASIDLHIYSEAEDNGMAVTNTLMLVASAAASFSPGYPEEQLTYAWTLTVTGGTGTLTPNTGTGGIIRATGPATITQISVQVIVTDPDSLTDTLVVSRAITSATTYRQDLYLAVDTDAVYLDGERTARDEVLPGAATTPGLAAFGPPWGMVWPASDGHIYATFDNLQTAVVDLGQPHGAVAATAVFVHELDDSRIWVGFTDGAVYFGQLDVDAQTVVWEARTTIPEGPVREIRESYNSYGGMRATAGTGYYASEDGANTWTKLETFDVAWRMAAGWDENLSSGLNDSEPLRSEAGTTVTLPVLVPPVTHIRGLTAGWRTRAYYLVDNLARLFASDGDNLLTFLHVATAPTGINHMIRSGGIDGKIYLAGDNGAYVWIPATSYLQRFYATADPVSMIGYGVLHGPVETVTTELLRPTVGVYPGGVYHRTLVSGVWTWVLKNSGLPGVSDGVTVNWRRVAVDDADPNTWAVLGNTAASDSYTQVGTTLFMANGVTSALWRTADNGATFTAVALTLVTHPGISATRNVTQVEWDQGRLCVVGYGGPAAPGSLSYLWAGNPASGTLPILAQSLAWSDFTNMVSGISGDMVLAEFDDPAGSSFGRTAYVPTGGGFTSILPAPTSFLVAYGISAGLHLDRIPNGSRAIVAVDQAALSGLWATSDYHTTPMRQRAAAVAGLYIAATADGVYVAGRAATGAGTGGVLRVSDPLGTPTSEIVAGDNVATSYIRAARQSRDTISALVATKTGSADMFVYDGLAWATVTGPAVAAANLCAFVEIITRVVTA